MINTQTLEKDKAKIYNPRQQSFNEKLLPRVGLEMVKDVYMYIK